ncbi:methyltransferase domain-containing protein [Occultella glacieicola]|uniref:Methyltransferase domain-containing protein n=1 Tax=Occultella glacieicola TaxID=2518684 RepID=A0ABY2E4L0_9MICO|nr:class I SAM-dependent methyltransferase [Occultella glacieicola]TDE94054.1 methyltransferase domain-containing protein [Occultella glacieicola]
MTATGNSGARCPVCDTAELRPFYAQAGVPTHVGILWPSRQEAVDCPRGDLDLGYCPECAFVYNTGFDASLNAYGHSYDNALHFSAVFQSYERDLARRLIDTYDVRDADVVEIGSGSGHFLGLICDLGENRGMGFDPSYDAEHAEPLPERVRVVNEYFSREHVDTKADLVICRHVLEHVDDPAGMLRSLREGIGDRPDTVLYLEVPNGLLALRRLSIGDLIYEHVSYFLASSLRTAVESAGFEILDLRESYDGQFLSVEARPTSVPARPSPARPAPEVLADIQAFADRARERVTAWTELLERLAAAEEPVVAWGAGAKAVGFFNVLEVTTAVDRVVDVNPRKQGTYLAGTGQAVVAPDALVSDPPGTVLVMNPYYATEIGQTLIDLGVDANVQTV